MTEYIRNSTLGALQISDLERRLSDALQENVELRLNLALARETADGSVLEALESVSEGFAVFDADDRLTFFNERYAEFFGPEFSDILAPGMAVEAIIYEGTKRGVFGSRGENPGQVESALFNLAINASHAMPDGVTLTIILENTIVTDPEWADQWEGRPGEYVALQAIDTGTGISPGVLGRVFEPFFTTKDFGQGSGLGLSMVYGFAQQFGGFASIESEEGKGATVTIYLPRDPSDRPGDEALEPVSALLRGGGETILLVEHEEAVRLATRRILEFLGYRILEADDGNEAKRIIADETTIDLMLSDLILPGGLNGYQIYRAIVEHRPNMKCLFMSGYASLSDDQQPDGALLLEKPVDLRVLTTRLRKISTRNQRSLV